MLEHNRNGNRMLKTIPIRSIFCFPVKWSLGLIDFWQKILSSGKQWILSDYNNFLPQWLNNVRNVFNKMDLYIFVSMWIMQRHILTKIVLELVKIFFMHEEKFSFFSANFGEIAQSHNPWFSNIYILHFTSFIALGIASY